MGTPAQDGQADFANETNQILVHGLHGFTQEVVA